MCNQKERMNELRKKEEKNLTVDSEIKRIRFSKCHFVVCMHPTDTRIRSDAQKQEAKDDEREYKKTTNPTN